MFYTTYLTTKKEEEIMKKKENKVGIYLLLHAILMIYAVGGIFSKKAGMAEFLSKEFLFNYMLVFAFLVFYAFFWQKVLKKLPLTVAMANKSVTVIWGIVYGILFFHEKIRWTNCLGAVLIIIGICVVVKADEEGEKCI